MTKRCLNGYHFSVRRNSMAPTGEREWRWRRGQREKKPPPDVQCTFKRCIWISKTTIQLRLNSFSCFRCYAAGACVCVCVWTASRLLFHHQAKAVKFNFRSYLIRSFAHETFTSKYVSFCGQLTHSKPYRQTSIYTHTDMRAIRMKIIPKKDPSSIETV